MFPRYFFSVVCNLHVQILIFFYLHLFFTFSNFIFSTFLNIGARSQLGRKFCSFPLLHPIYFDNNFLFVIMWQIEYL